MDYIFTRLSFAKQNFGGGGVLAISCVQEETTLPRTSDKSLRGHTLIQNVNIKV